MHRFFCLVVAASSLSQAGVVSAASPDDIALQPEPPLQLHPQPQPQPQPSGRLALARVAGWQNVPAEQLAGKRAGADTVSNNMDLNGAVSGNSAINVVTGANAISSGAFSNASGLPVAIQNSGANVLIQNATIINVQMK